MAYHRKEGLSYGGLRCRARNVRRSASAGSLNNGGEAGLVDGDGEAEARAEQGALAGLRGMRASPGRPNISAVLARMVQEYSSQQEIGVVAAGAPHASSRSRSSPPSALVECHCAVLWTQIPTDAG